MDRKDQYSAQMMKSLKLNQASATSTIIILNRLFIDHTSDHWLHGGVIQII